MPPFLHAFRPGSLAPVFCVAVLAGALALAGCDLGHFEDPDGDEPDAGARGELVRTAPMGQRTADELSAALSPLVGGLLPDGSTEENAAALIDLLASQINANAYDVELHRLIYRTVDADGDPVRASGVVAMPQAAQALDGGRPLVLYGHGTTPERDRAPSVAGYDDLETLAINLLFARDGYVAAIPDYLGSGAATLPAFAETPADPFHPYVVAEPYATASVDFLRAVRAFAEQQSVAMTGELFVTGYSEGGYAAMATHRAIQQDYAGEFAVTASAPMAGPYDLSGTMRRRLLAFQPVPSPYYLPYVLHSYNRIYDLYDDFDEALKPEYAGLGAYFDGTHSGSEINAQVPQPPRGLLRDEVIAAFQDDRDHPLRQALRENDLWGWAPQAPVQMGHSPADEEVPYQNAVVALQEFEARGAGGRVSLVNANDAMFGGLFFVDPAHAEAFVPLSFEAKRFFNEVRGAAPPEASLSRRALRNRVRRLGYALPSRTR